MFVLFFQIAKLVFEIYTVPLAVVFHLLIAVATRFGFNPVVIGVLEMLLKIYKLSVTSGRSFYYFVYQVTMSTIIYIVENRGGIQRLFQLLMLISCSSHA